MFNDYEDYLNELTKFDELMEEMKDKLHELITDEAKEIMVAYRKAENVYKKIWGRKIYGSFQEELFMKKERLENCIYCKTKLKKVTKSIGYCIQCDKYYKNNKEIFYSELLCGGMKMTPRQYLSRVILLAKKYGITLKEIAAHNVSKLKERYPDGFSESKSRNRDQRS